MFCVSVAKLVMGGVVMVWVCGCVSVTIVVRGFGVNVSVCLFNTVVIAEGVTVSSLGCPLVILCTPLVATIS